MACLAIESMLCTSFSPSGAIGEWALAARSERFLGLRSPLVNMMLEEGDGQLLGLCVDLRPMRDFRLLQGKSKLSDSVCREITLWISSVAGFCRILCLPRSYYEFGCADEMPPAVVSSGGSSKLAPDLLLGFRLCLAGFELPLS